MELDSEYIKSKIQELLKVAHTDKRKWRLKEFPDRLQFSCPICGDSQVSPGQKLRGILYKKNLSRPTIVSRIKSNTRYDPGKGDP